MVHTPAASADTSVLLFSLYGLFVTLRITNPEGIRTVYAHLQDQEISGIVLPATTKGQPGCLAAASARASTVFATT